MTHQWIEFKALKFAEKAHRDITRKYSDSPYILHPIRVMYRVMETGSWCSDDICAALLHDVPEDCHAQFGGIENAFKVLEKEFDLTITNLVRELTQPDKLSEDIHKLPRTERHKLLLEKLEKISLQGARIKYFDRLDNVSDVDLSNNECYGFFKKRYIQESWDICKLLSVRLLKSNMIHYDDLGQVIKDLAVKCKVELK